MFPFVLAPVIPQLAEEWTIMFYLLPLRFLPVSSSFPPFLSLPICPRENRYRAPLLSHRLKSRLFFKQRTLVPPTSALSSFPICWSEFEENSGSITGGTADLCWFIGVFCVGRGTKLFTYSLDVLTKYDWNTANTRKSDSCYVLFSHVTTLPAQSSQITFLSIVR